MLLPSVRFCTAEWVCCVLSAGTVDSSGNRRCMVNSAVRLSMTGVCYAVLFMLLCAVQGIHC